MLECRVEYDELVIELEQKKKLMEKQAEIKVLKEKAKKLKTEKHLYMSNTEKKYETIKNMESALEEEALEYERYKQIYLEMKENIEKIKDSILAKINKQMRALEYTDKDKEKVIEGKEREYSELQFFQYRTSGLNTSSIDKYATDEFFSEYIQEDKEKRDARNNENEER